MTADGRKLPPVCVCVSGERYSDGRMLMIEIQFILHNLKKLKLGTTDCGKQTEEVNSKEGGRLSLQYAIAPPTYHHQLLSVTPHSHKQAPPIFLLQKMDCIVCVQKCIQKPTSSGTSGGNSRRHRHKRQVKVCLLNPGIPSLPPKFCS